MTNAAATLTVAEQIASRTTDAYSFGRYGLKNWTTCADMLLARGYNEIETECILRSVFTRYALDNITTRRKATVADLADLLDNRSGGPANLRQYVDEIVAETLNPTPEKLNSRDALRLVWSR